MLRKLLNRRPLRKVSVTIAAGTLAATGLLAGAAGPAQAVAGTCSMDSSGLPNGGGQAVMKVDVNM